MTRPARAVRLAAAMRGIGLAALAATAAGAQEACREDVATLKWPGGTARFAVEIADDAGERAQGLMNRESLPRAAGMLFVYDRPGPVAFWMKNTLIPLDMLFIAADGRVGRVHENAIPGDLTPIPGPADTLMVLEINGGLARRLGIGEGAILRHPRLDPALAQWPCPQG